MKHQLRLFGLSIGLLIYFNLFTIPQLQGQELDQIFTKTELGVKVDLLSVNGLSLRMQLFDKLSLSEKISVAEPTPGLLLISWKKMSNEDIL